MKHTAFLVCVALAAPVLAQQAATPPAAVAVRPPQWAVRMPRMEGVANLYRITPMLYRSEQPTAAGMKNLEKLGIRTVINLRVFNDDDDEVKGTHLRTARVSVLTWRIGDKHVIRVLRQLRDTANGPFLIHCQHGSDRTGLMSAMYRVLEQGWTADDALKELTEGGYGFHSMWKNIPRYLRSADVDKLRKAIGSLIDSPTSSTSTVTDNL
jgi:protein tyrosine/serine phosphatase